MLKFKRKEKNMKGLLNDCTDEQLKAIVQESDSYSECLRKIGYVAVSGNILKVFKARLESAGIDTSHFEYHSKDKTARTRDNVFVENATCCQAVLRRWFTKEDVEYKCSICGQEPFWNGKEMTLILDHINGKNHDNRLENLRWVCPNCNSQLDTTNGKNIKHRIRVAHEFFCEKCAAPVSRGKTLCKKCSSERNRKVPHPNFIDLAKLVKDHGFAYVGKEYGISGRAVQKWFEQEGLPHNKAKVIEWYNQQLGIKPTINAKQRKSIHEIMQPVKQIDIQSGKVIKIFSSQSEAAKGVGKPGGTSHISDVCKGKRKIAYGYKWEYVN